jgi:ATP-dependent 26S proteasome regulatory subunit
MTFLEKLRHYVDACYPALWVQTHEEGRICKDIFSAFAKKATKDETGCKVYEWDSVVGLYEKLDEDKTKNIKDTDDPSKMFVAIKSLCSNEDSEAVFIIKDFHLQFEKPLKKIDYIRGFKNIINFLKAKRNMVIFVSPVVKVPVELQKEIQLLDYALPDEEAIGRQLNFVIESVNESKKGKDKLVVADEVRERAVESAKGMTDSEVESAFSLAIVQNKQFDLKFVHSVFSEKIMQIKKGGLLNHLETDIDFSKVGGLAGIKDWIKTRKHAFSKKARNYGLPYPKGLGLAGIAGCGKTLISKAIANEFGFPLFQLDLGSLFSKYVGETEGNFIAMIKTVESIGRCVILIDEIEKYLNSGATSGHGDSGTSSRSFGTLLSWLSDRNSPAFIIFTSNNHLALPVELVRKGRFDELFWIDLPTEDEVKEVYNVVIRKYGRDPKNFNIDSLQKKSMELTGAEIDNLFKDALFAAYADGEREVTNDDVINEIEVLTPQSKINEVAITQMREKVIGRLRPAADYPALKEFAPNAGVGKAMRKVRA